MSTIPLLFLAGCLLPGDLPSSHDHQLFGLSIAPLGDVNRDEKPDFAVGDPADPVGGDWAGRVWIVSSADWTSLGEIRGDREQMGLGMTLAAPGDLDGDGVPDLLVGECGEAGVGPAAVGAYSLESEESLYRIELRAEESMCVPWYTSVSGPALAAIGDVDGDGIGDFVIGVAHESSKAVDAGCVQVHSGASGKQLFRFDGLAAGDQLGASVAAAGDVNGDGTPDLIVGARPVYVSEEEGLQRPGYALVLSGKEGKVLLSLTSEGGSRAFGTTVAGVGDLDGDGRPDVAVGRAFDHDSRAAVIAFSGADGALLRTWKGTHEESKFSFGAQVLSVGDVYGGGIPDLLITAPTSFGSGESAVIYSGTSSKSLMTIPGSERFGESHFGVSAAALGDLDGDGVSEVVIAAASIRSGGSMPGAVHVYSPGKGKRLAHLTRKKLLATGD